MAPGFSLQGFLISVLLFTGSTGQVNNRPVYRPQPDTVNLGSEDRGLVDQITSNVDLTFDYGNPIEPAEDGPPYKAEDSPGASNINVNQPATHNVQRFFHRDVPDQNPQGSNSRDKPITFPINHGQQFQRDRTMLWFVPQSPPDPYIRPVPQSPPDPYIRPVPQSPPDPYIRPVPQSPPDPYIRPVPQSPLDPYIRPVPQSPPDPYIRPVPQSPPKSYIRPVPQTPPKSSIRPVPQSPPDPYRPAPQSPPNSYIRPAPQSPPDPYNRPVPQSPPSPPSNAWYSWSPVVSNRFYGVKQGDNGRPHFPRGNRYGQQLSSYGGALNRPGNNVQQGSPEGYPTNPPRANIPEQKSQWFRRNYGPMDDKHLQMYHLPAGYRIRPRLETEIRQTMSRYVVQARDGYLKPLLRF